MGFVGAGFVIGIRMVGEWFPARQVGLAEGVYGGWGNFGSAAAAMSLPTLAMVFGGENGWRYALYCTAAIASILRCLFLHCGARHTRRGRRISSRRRAVAWRSARHVIFISCC